MDEKTLKYYSANARNASGLYNSAKAGGVSSYFKSAFTAGSTVLDIGAGSGRDMSILLEQGFDAYGIDASAGMAEEAIRSMPSLRGRIICAEIPSDKPFFNMKFDGVLCSAVLMHVTGDRIEDAARCIRNCLKDNGRLLVSVPLTREDLDGENRAPDGRLFILRPMDFYSVLFERAGFGCAGVYEEADSLGRNGIHWGVGVYKL